MKDLIDELRACANGHPLDIYAPIITSAADAIESQAREIASLHRDYDEASEDAMIVARQLSALKAQPSGVVLPEELTDEMRNSMAYVPGLSDTTMQDLLWLALKLARLNQPASAQEIDDLGFMTTKQWDFVYARFGVKPASACDELTDVRCQCCQSEHAHDSYDAGFIAGSGICQVCDAAMPPKDLPSAGDERAEFEVCGVTVKRNEVGDWEYLSEGYGNDPDIWVACSDILGRFGGGGVDELLTAYAELQARAALSANHSEQVREVPSVQITGHIDEVDTPVWEFINVEARKLGPITGSIDSYGLSRPNGGQPNGSVVVLWNGPKIHAVAMAVRDAMNRTVCVRLLAAAPSSGSQGGDV